MKTYLITLIILVLFIINCEQDTGISMTEATDIVLNEIIRSDTLGKSLHRLPYKLDGNSDAVGHSDTSFSVNYTSWFFMIDDGYYFDWCHDCRYVFLSDDGEEYQIFNTQYYPSIMSEMDTFKIWPLSGNESNTYSSDDLIPLNDSTLYLYYKDAAYIEFDSLTQDETLKYEQVVLDSVNINEYYNDLVCIYNNCYKLSDSFFENITRIHTYNTDELFEIIVSVDTCKNWGKQLANDIYPSDNEAINDIISNYNLVVGEVNDWGNSYGFLFKSESPVNVLALSRKFEETGEVEYAEKNSIMGDGATITLKSINGNKIYEFTIGWGDCPAGCISEHYWKIKVSAGSLSLYEEGGDSL